MEKERITFTPIPGFSNYEISKQGEIRRLWKNTKPTFMVQHIKRRQYNVRLRNDEGKRTTELTHKLMQRTYMRPPKPNEVVYHKNGNRLDNWINNLGYIDRKELGRITGGQSRKAVIKIDPQTGSELEIYRSARAAAKVNYMSYQTVIDHCNGKRIKHAPDGYMYRWEDGK
jgi:hypothetical protein